jgi:hypothetical protein
MIERPRVPIFPKDVQSSHIDPEHANSKGDKIVRSEEAQISSGEHVLREYRLGLGFIPQEQVTITPLPKKVQAISPPELLPAPAVASVPIHRPTVTYTAILHGPREKPETQYQPAPESKPKEKTFK